MTRPQTRAAARRIATRVREGVEDAGHRLTALARARQPALGSAVAAEVETVRIAELRPQTSGLAREAAAAPAPPTAQDLSWALARHVSERIAELQAWTLHTDLRAPEGSHDPESVRRVRISARRLRSFADLFAPWIGRKRGLRILHALRTITRVLGPLRDLDGSMVALNEAHKNGAPLLRAAAEQLRCALALEQRAAIDAAERAFGALDVPRLQRDLDVARSRVCDRLIESGTSLPAALHETYRLHAETLFSETPIPRTLEHMERVHDVRITAKRLRYALEWMRPALLHGPGPKRPLKRAQRVIGKARDLELRAALVEEQAATLRGAGLTTLADALGPWREQLTRAHGRAAERILPALDKLDPAVLVRLHQEALGFAEASDVSSARPTTETRLENPD